MLFPNIIKKCIWSTGKIGWDYFLYSYEWLEHMFDDYDNWKRNKNYLLERNIGGKRKNIIKFRNEKLIGKLWEH